MRSLLLVAASLTLVLACGASHPDAKSPPASASSASSASSSSSDAQADAMASGLLLDGKAETRVLGGAQPVPSVAPTGSGAVRTGNGN